MRIVQLEAENVKRLKAVSVRPSGSVVKIGGRNGQGKTSLLDAIQMALGGKSLQPPKVIRTGQETARVVLELDDLVVERHWTSNEKSYLEVRSKDGAKFPSPQGMLDKLTGALSFDPIAFMRAEPKKQVATLRKLVGVDTTPLDQQRAAVFEQRTQVNRTVATAKARVDGLPAVDAPDEELSLQELLAEREKLQAKAEENRRARDAVTSGERNLALKKRDVERWNGEVEELEERLAEARDRRDSAVAAAASVADDVEQAKQAAAALVDPDLSAVDSQLKTIEETNRRVRAKKARAAAQAGLTKLTAQADGLSEEISSLDAQREMLLAGAEFPIDGLAFGDEGLTLNGLPLEQASAAEQLRVSLAMGLALNPELKVVTIRDGSLLDEDSMAMVEAMAEKHGAQVWIEMVGKGGQVSVLIEDGEATGRDAQVPTAGDAA